MAVPRKTLQPSFTTGEVSPRLYSRVDVQRFDSAARTLKNFIIYPQGGVYRRPGTRFVKEVKDSSDATRVIPFEFSDTQAYILELGDQYFRVYKDSANVESGGSPVEVSTVFTSADLFDIKFTQSADILYLVHKDHPPQQITRTSDTAWSIAAVDFVDGPWLDENTEDSPTVTSAATTGTGIALSASANLFVSTDVGRMVRIRSGSGVGWGTITAYTDEQNVTWDIEEDVPAGAQTAWRLGAFSETTGYPRAITFHDQRLCFAGTVSDPQTVWMSVVNDFVYFTPTDPEDASVVLDDSAVKFTIASNKVNVIRWLLSSNVLIIGTIGAEWRAWTGDSQAAITPSNITISEIGDSGNNGVRPIKIDSSTVFVQRSERSLREFVYDFTINGYRSKDLTILCEHLMREANGIVDISWQQEPDQVIWMVRSDGKLIGATYMREQEIFGCHLHELGGSFGSDDFAHVESVATIPHSDGDQDQLWMVVKRTIDGATKRYIEYMEKPHYPTSVDDKDGMNFLDSSVEYSGSATTSITGLDHLEAETVSILADGADTPDETVSSGGYTLDAEASVVQSGLAYTSTLATLEAEVNGEGGTSQGKIGRITEVQVRLKDSLSFKYGKDETDLDPLYFRSTNDTLSQSPPLFSGWKRFKLNDSFDRDNRLTIQTSKPYPLEILAIAPTIWKFE